MSKQREWQPIETAPKDDGWMLAASAGRVHLVARTDGELLDVGKNPDTGEIGMYESAFTFTHWMPLPDPPSEAKR